MFKTVINDLKVFHENENGDIVQTSIIIGVFAVLAIGALTFLGPKIKSMFDQAGKSLDGGAKIKY